mmetsp:Transcript_46764/g.141855  ORF Transcript_46764/g.141855 Transcript_46764/m.141855 type:complete len:244 (-) Transcript_46764:22-753(-)
MSVALESITGGGPLTAWLNAETPAALRPQPARVRSSSPWASAISKALRASAAQSPRRLQPRKSSSLHPALLGENAAATSWRKPSQLKAVQRRKASTSSAPLGQAPERRKSFRASATAQASVSATHPSSSKRSSPPLAPRRRSNSNATRNRRRAKPCGKAPRSTSCAVRAAPHSCQAIAQTAATAVVASNATPLPTYQPPRERQPSANTAAAAKAPAAPRIATVLIMNLASASPQALAGRQSVA